MRRACAFRSSCLPCPCPSPCAVHPALLSSLLADGFWFRHVAPPRSPVCGGEAGGSGWIPGSGGKTPRSGRPLLTGGAWRVRVGIESRGGGTRRTPGGAPEAPGVPCGRAPSGAGFPKCVRARQVAGERKPGSRSVSSDELEGIRSRGLSPGQRLRRGILATSKRDLRLSALPCPGALVVASSADPDPAFLRCRRTIARSVLALSVREVAVTNDGVASAPALRTKACVNRAMANVIVGCDCTSRPVLRDRSQPDYRSKTLHYNLISPILNFKETADCAWNAPRASTSSNEWPWITP